MASSPSNAFQEEVKEKEFGLEQGGGRGCMCDHVAVRRSPGKHLLCSEVKAASGQLCCRLSLAFVTVPSAALEPRKCYSESGTPEEKQMSEQVFLQTN